MITMHKFVTVPEAAKKEREEFYQAVPEAGPPGTPGKVTPEVAIARREKDIAKFEASHIKLKDSKGEDVWIPIESIKDKEGNIVTMGWNEWPEKYQTIALKENFDKAMEAVKVDNKEYEEFQKKLASGEIIALPDGEYIAKTELDKMPEGTQQIIKESGFAGLEVATAKTWEHIRTGKIISDEEHSKLEGSELDYYHLSVPSGRRALAQIVSFVVPPVRATLPEYTVGDISTVEWGLAGVNVALIAAAFAPGVIMGSVAGKAIVTGISTTGAGLVGYETAKNWSELTPVQRGIGVGATVLYALPMLNTVARGIKITTAKPIPTAGGEISSWRGLSIAQHPIIGRSGGKWVVGTRNITLPEARLIMEGYKPEMMLETKVFVNPKALAKAGFSKKQIDYLTLSLKDRNLFAGKKSPFLAKDVVLEPTQRLNVDEIGVLFKQINKYNKKIKQVDMLYGSSTVKPQLAPELRGWRPIHDWDIQFTVGTKEMSAWLKETLALLKKLPGKRQYRIQGTLILKKINGKWKHIVDAHSREVVSSLPVKDIPKSKLDATGEYSYGRMVAEPAITVKYPGAGKFDIMALSESGVRKSDTILRVRQTEIGTAFRPPERGIAQPGVPKDAADFYVILRTFKGEKIAEDWLKSWAKAMGYTEKELAKVLSNIRKAMEEVVANSPSNLIGYRFTPAESAAVAKGASPTVTIHIPSSLGASVSSSLARQISSPILPYKLSPEIASSASLTVSDIASQLPSATSPAIISQVIATSVPSMSASTRSKISKSISKSISPLVSKGASLSSVSLAVSRSLSPYVSKGVISSLISASISKAVSTSPSLSPSLFPSPYPSPSPKPSPSPSPSPYPSPKPEPKPVPEPVPIPIPSPKPVPTPVPKPVPPKVVPTPEIREVRERKDYKGAVAWQQGALLRKGKLVPIWKVWSRPYRQEDLETFFEDELPPGVKTVAGIKSAYATIQQFRGKIAPRETQEADIGAFIATVSRPTGKPGGAGEIKFARDPKDMPKATYQSKRLRRKKAKTKKVKSEPMLIGARL